MAERATRRPAGATRLPAQPRGAQVSLLPALDASGFTHDQLVQALLERGLATTGTDAGLKTRLQDAVLTAYTAAAPAPAVISVNANAGS